MKRLFPLFTAVLLFITLSIPASASLGGTIIGGGSTGSGSSAPAIDPDSPTAEDSIFGPLGDDYFDEEDFISFDEETMSESSEMLKNSLGSMTNIAAYGMILLLGIFAAAEVISEMAL